MSLANELDYIRTRVQPSTLAEAMWTLQLPHTSRVVWWVGLGLGLDAVGWKTRTLATLTFKRISPRRLALIQSAINTERQHLATTEGT
jgi:hypothetical protein